jgi:hypothetical protein
MRCACAISVGAFTPCSAVRCMSRAPLPLVFGLCPLPRDLVQNTRRGCGECAPPTVPAATPSTHPFDCGRVLVCPHNVVFLAPRNAQLAPQRTICTTVRSSHLLFGYLRFPAFFCSAFESNFAMFVNSSFSAICRGVWPMSSLAFQAVKVRKVLKRVHSVRIHNSQ